MTATSVLSIKFQSGQPRKKQPAQSLGSPLCWVTGLLDFHPLRLADGQFVPGTGSLWTRELYNPSPTVCPLWFDLWSEDSFKSMKSKLLGQNVEIAILLGLGCPRWWYKVCRPILWSVVLLVARYVLLARNYHVPGFWPWQDIAICQWKYLLSWTLGNASGFWGPL